MAFNLTPEALALMMGGLNMMAASRGGNPDLTKGGFGYAALQGLQGGLQGLQLGKQMQDADVERAQRDQKQKAIDDMLMKLNLSPSAMQSTGVLAPGVQQSPLAQMSPEQKELAKMAILSGDWKSVANMITPEPIKPTSVMQNAAAMGLRPGTPEYNEFVRAAVLRPDTVISMGQIKAPTGYMIDPENPNRVKKIPGMDFDQAQLKAAGYANRMAQAEGLSSEIVKSGYTPGNIYDQMAASLGTPGNYVMSQEGQQFRQAQEDWVRAKLRLESGAVIGEEEMKKEIETYFPKAGDTDKVIAQKARARQIAIDNLVKESQGAYEANFGQKPVNPEDMQALEWAKKNPTDPRAQQILKLQGAK